MTAVLAPGGGYPARQLDIDLQHRNAAGVLDLHGDLVLIHANVLGDNPQQIPLQLGQEVRPLAARLLMGEKDLQPLLGSRRQTLEWIWQACDAAFRAGLRLPGLVGLLCRIRAIRRRA